MNTRLSFCAALALSLCTATVALADEPTTVEPTTVEDASARATDNAPAATLNPFTMALLAGHGFNDGFRTGFGGRLGYTLPNKIYLGASFLHHLGTTDGPTQSSVSHGGGEVGYELLAGPFVIRPYVGAGVARLNVKITVPELPILRVSESRVAFWPGAALLIPFENGAAFVGLDAKLVVVDSASAFNAYGTFGLAL